MTLADELAEIAGRVSGARAELAVIDRRLQRPFNSEQQVSELRRERGKAAAECLSYRLAMLYLIEERWGELMTALTASSTTRAHK